MGAVVVANWDLDGQASASMLIRSGYASDVFMPSVGYYWLEDIWIETLSSYDTIYIVDMHFPRKTVERLTTTSYVFVIDDSYIYPDYTGLKVSCICGHSYSTTYTIMDNMGVEPDIDAILGMYNDSGTKIINSEYWDIFSKYLEQLGITFEDLEILKNYFNSPYYVNDLSSLYLNIDLLLNRDFHIDDLPGYEERMSIIDAKNKYIDSLLGSEVDENDIIMLRYRGKMYVIGEVAQRLHSLYPGRSILVIDEGFIPEHVSIAVVSKSNIEHLLRRFMEMGLPAGGERNFLGVVVDEHMFKEIYQILISNI